MTATITLATVQTELALWLAAKNAAAKGQTVSLNGRSWTTIDLPAIKTTIAELSRQERQFLDAARTGKRSSRLGVSYGTFK